MKKILFGPLFTFFAAIIALFMAWASTVDAGHFRATYSGELAFTTDESGNVIGAIGSGAGFGTQIGFITTSGNVAFIGPPVNGCDNGFRTDHVDVVESDANGDQLYFEALADACPTPEDPCAYLVTGTYTIIGGTGRLANASGEGTFEAHPEFSHESGCMLGKYFSILTGSLEHAEKKK